MDTHGERSTTVPRPTERFIPPTPGTRIAAWIFPTVTTWLGIGYLAGPDSRLQSPAYKFAQTGFSGHGLPMWGWGLIFLTVAALKVASLLFAGDDPRPFVVAMCAGMGLYVCWGILIAGSVLTDDRTSLGAPALPIGWAAMHIAFLATLTGRRIR